MLQIRQLRTKDIQFAVKLSNREKWNTPRSDFERILRLNPHGNFLALSNRSRVGMITTVRFEEALAWIGNVVVDRRYRGRYIGQAMVEYAVSYLRDAGVKNIGLYCFLNNVRFYEKLGFVKDVKFERLRRAPKQMSHLSDYGFAKMPISQVLNIDRRSFRANRANLLTEVLRSGFGSCLGVANQSSAAYLMIRHYSDMHEFGPGIAIRVTSTKLESLIATAIRDSGRKPIELSCVATNKPLLRFLKSQGFRTVNSGYRMFLGRGTWPGDNAENYLLGFKDKG